MLALLAGTPMHAFITLNACQVFPAKLPGKQCACGADIHSICNAAGIWNV